MENSKSHGKNCNRLYVRQDHEKNKFKNTQNTNIRQKINFYYIKIKMSSQ